MTSLPIMISRPNRMHQQCRTGCVVPSSKKYGLINIMRRQSAEDTTSTAGTPIKMAPCPSPHPISAETIAPTLRMLSP